jgi:hypothetical protein
MLNQSSSPKSKLVYLAGECYLTCDELPMYNFIELSVSGDAKWLVKSGTPNTAQALEAIQSEYAELSGDDSQSEILKASINLEYFTNKLRIFTDIVETLRLRPVLALCDVLKEMGFNFDFNDLQSDLTRAETQSKQWIVKINHAKHILDSRKNNTSPPTKKVWYDRLSHIAKYRQVVSINPRNITVMEYIAMDKDFTDYVNRMNNG